MKLITVLVVILLTAISGESIAQKEPLSSSPTSLVQSAIKGTKSQQDTLIFRGDPELLKPESLQLIGENASYFKVDLLKPERSPVNLSQAVVIGVLFEPSADFIGIAHAALTIKSLNKTVNLIGLSTKGLEGENEPPLSTVVKALGYSTDVGWTALANHWRPELQGDELPSCQFKKVGNEPVELIPVARYSPDFQLNFGYYTHSAHGPEQHQVGVLAKSRLYPQHQRLFPKVASGKTTFDPADKPFGLYVINPSHTIYSDDIWNILFYPAHATHAVRTYPLKDNQGKLVPNEYLVCVEEATNGDFNDYVFIIKQVQPIYVNEQFSTLFNGKNFDGWYSWFQHIGKDKDPDKNFSIEPDGVIHDSGKNLGYLMTKATFGNYHFRLDFKWGEKRWPPRETNKRDSGICYNIPDGETDGIWPKSVECQIQEGDVGDFWLLDNSTIQVDGKQNFPSAHTQILKKKDAEKPKGDWNTVEVISFQGKCVHIVNGTVVNYGENSSLIGGRILVQSEYAEVYYRNIKLRELN